MLEHGAYNLILDAYYDREVPPTRAEAIRYARARSIPEIAAVDAVLSEFFQEQDGRYTQSRVEEEFAEAAVQAEKNRDNGKKGGRPRKPVPTTSAKPKITQPVISGNPDETQTKGNPLIHQSINPEEQKQQRVQASPAPSRFADFWTAYPVKKGKQEAEKCWRKLGLDAVADELIAHVRLMADTDSDWQRGYAPMGSTYLNQARWEDVPKRPPSAAPPAAPSKTFSAIQQLEAMKNGLADTRNLNGIPEATLLELGSDSGD